MSAISADYPAAAYATGSSASPTVNAATEPAAIRNGDATAKKAYQEGLGFEQLLVSQLAQSMTSTLSGSSSDDDGLGGSSSGGSGSSDSAMGTYSSLITQAMSSGVMSGGGTGIAMQIAEAVDPQLSAAVHSGTGHVAGATAMSTPTAASTSSTSTTPGVS